ncbi:N-acetylmuramoyl-L-alanine amidase [Lactonifactor sp. BIOML-A4]|uniref:peptidoglycan recognition protein family protein n=1 Tax=unclassified Lactonifactor TaxID=2636670 RepID=UPI00325A9AC7
MNRIKYIVIHYVGAVGGAKANCQYFAGGDRGASAHYFIDYNGDIWQSVEDANIAWHCGTKSGYKHPECRNANSIGIELCVRNKGSQTDTSKDWYFEDATVWAAAELTKHLMQKYNVPADHVLRHYDVTGKICPNPYVYNTTKHTWTEFKSLISSAGRNYMQIGDSGEEVKQLQKDLNTLGYNCGTADGIYGKKTAAAVEKLQKATGLAADGMAGIKTLAKIDELLNAKPQWIQQGGRWWYRHADGSYTKSGWEKIGGTWYYFDAAGLMKTGWVLLGKSWYYLKSSGAMACNELLKIGNELFYFTSEGHMGTTNGRGALV